MNDILVCHVFNDDNIRRKEELMKKRLLENIFFYFSGFFIVSIFLIIAFIIASINLDKSVQKEAGLELESGTDRLEDMEDRIRMLNNVIIQDTTFNTLVYTDGTSAASVTAIKNLNSLYRNLSIIANDVSYIFTLFDSSDIFLSSSDTTFDFTDYYTKFMSVQYNGNEISSAQELRQLLLSSYRQGLTHLKLDYITYVSSTGLIMEENPLIILHSSSSLSSDPLFLSVFRLSFSAFSAAVNSWTKIAFFPFERSFAWSNPNFLLQYAHCKISSSTTVNSVAPQ